MKLLLTAILCLFLLSACAEPPMQAVGQLESDRIELVAEFSEPIISIEVTEGDKLVVGAVVLQQDSTRVDLKIDEAEANIKRVEALLNEQRNGPRVETVQAMRANLAEVEIERNFRRKELDRLSGLREKNLTSIESVDTAQKLLESAGARIELVNAQLAELEAGTRVEQIEQTENLLLQAQSQLAGLELDKRRLTISVPVNAIVDSLPFEVGERPRQGDVVAVLLAGEQPYARLYIPEAFRIRYSVGSQLQLTVDGLEGALTGTIRRIASEPSFTPYFALTERDRSRLSYIAEVSLPASANRLPDGIPVQSILE